jgi:hypothetical protein
MYEYKLLSKWGARSWEAREAREAREFLVFSF